MKIKYDKCDILYGHHAKNMPVNYLLAIYLISNPNNTLFAK